MKSSRLRVISKLVSEQPIATQEELLVYLREQGYNVTQATVSRDIKELRLIKVTDADGTTRYASPSETGLEEHSGKFRTIFRESVISVRTAGNLVVLKCYTGMGNAACAALDSMGFEHIVGTIAGDDTIFCAVESPADAKEVVKILNTMIQP